MPTKFLVVETPQFQLGANAGAGTERIDPVAFPARWKQHVESRMQDHLFVIAPSELRLQQLFGEIASGSAPASVAFFGSAGDAIRFLPSLLIFDGAERSEGAKEMLAKGSTIYNESFFNAKAVGTKLDPCFVFARGQLPAANATQAWACLQSLVFLGLQHLPEVGEKGTGEKVDVQLGADEKFLALTVRFELSPERLPFLKANPILSLPRFAAGMFEVRYLAAGHKVELNCLFFRAPGLERTIEITTFQPSAALENGDKVKDYSFRNFGAIPAEGATAPKAKGGFKKKFSDQVRVADGNASAADSTRVSGPNDGPTSMIQSGADAPYKQPTLVVSGKAGLGTEKSDAVVVGGGGIVFERETVFKNEGAAARVIELEAQIKHLEAQLKTKDELLSKTKPESDALGKRDVITNIKDSQNEGLKQTIKTLEAELEEAKKREMELMKMVDKAVQMKDDAAKKIKELDVKLKATSGSGGSKVQMLEKALEEQKRQNKELSKRVTELNEKLRAA
jgi:hypothetical protein